MPETISHQKHLKPFNPILINMCSFLVDRFTLVLGYWGYLMSQEIMKNILEQDFGPVSKGLEKVIQEIQLSRMSLKMDKRLTGSSIIDEPLQEVN